MAHNNVNDGDNTHIRIAKFIGDTAYKIITVSNYTKNNFLEINSNAKVDVLYNCINVKEYISANQNNKRDELREKYNIESEDYVFIYSGRIDVYKGVLELVNAFKKIEQKGTKLVIVGKSWFDNNMEIDSYTKKLLNASNELEDNIVFTGFINPKEMPYIYQIADCLVIPSIWEEPFGVVALEGMGAKLPIIATNSGGLVEVVDSSNAYIVDKNINLEQSLSQRMCQMLKNPEVGENMGEHGYKKLMNKADYNCENYYKLFCEIINKR